MSRGHISTSTADGQPLTIYYIHRAPKKYEKLMAEVNVLAQFATAWNRREPDVMGKTPFEDAQPCTHIVVSGMSTNTPAELKHLTISPASDSSWEAGYARSGVHVYSIDDDTQKGYRGYRRTTMSKDRFQCDSIKRHLDEAKRTILADQGGK